MSAASPLVTAVELDKKLFELRKHWQQEQELTMMAQQQTQSKISNIAGELGQITDYVYKR
eukprot:SAG31_NODE_56_length_29726_cov_41.443312_5_plen_60_part_00